MLKRLFDIFFSFTGLLLASPVFLLLSLVILFESRGGIFYLQQRVGRYGKDFKLFKFRSMYVGSERKGLLTVGAKDSRITRIGIYLRKYKLDELPQLLNVLLGDMSFVGPRPEVRKYVALYSQEQLKVLSLKPGITDYASLLYFEENALLGKAADPEQTYIQEIMPAKLLLNLEYIQKQSLLYDLKLILLTITRVFGYGKGK